MRILGVVDLRGGRAVHAVAGDRTRYAPVATVAGVPIVPGDPQALAGGYRDACGVTDLYCADLDALLGEPPQAQAVTALAATGLPLWLDAAVTSADDAARARAIGASRVVVGLETLHDFASLADCSRAVGVRQVAFSLDLRDGYPLAANPALTHGQTPWSLAERAAEAGAGAVLVLDLARVGTGAGPDDALLARIRAAVPHVMLLAGGGVRDTADLARLADVGCDGILVATAFQNGRLRARDVAPFLAPTGDPDQNVTR